jgi:uncharacterized membrane protein
LTGCGGGGGGTSPTSVSNYTVTDLGTFQPSHINNQGEIVGSVNSIGTITPALWQNGSVVSVGPAGAHPTALNNSGVVAGTIPGAGGSVQAAILSGGSATPIATPGGSPAIPNAVNASGAVAGTFEAAATSGATQDHAFMTSGGAATELPPLSGYAAAQALAINDGGAVAGNVSRGTGFDAVTQHRAVVWSGAAPGDLGTFGGQNSAVYGINNNGYVVGYADVAGISSDPTLLRRAAEWHGGLKTELVSLALDSPAVANAINNHNVVVGSSTSAFGAQTAAIWISGSVFDLNKRIPTATGWVLQSAAGINDSGQIVGIGTHNGVAAGFLLTPQ